MGPLRVLLRELPRASRPATVAVAACALLEPALQTLSVILNGLLLAAITDTVRDGFDSPAGRSMVLRLVLSGATFIGVQLVEGVGVPLRGILARRVDIRTRTRVLRAVSTTPGIAHLEDPALLDLVERARRAGPGGGMDSGAAASGAAQLASRYLIVASGAVMLATFRWWVPLILAPILVWAGQMTRRHINVTIDKTVEMTGASRRARYLADLALTPAAAKELRLFGLGRWLRERHLQTSSDAIHPVSAARAASRKRLVVPELVRGAASLGINLLLVRSAVRGEISVATFGTLLGATSMLTQLTSMSNADVEFSIGSRALPAVDELEAVVERTRLRGDVAADEMPASAIRFEHVSFAYPGTDATVLDGFDLDIPVGGSLAIVGSNGAGKTTLIKLLSRFYDPTGGAITVDGVDLRTLDPASWQRRVAAIFQDFTRYELTAAENVGLGAPALQGDREALRDAAARAGALALIEGLPDGWETVLSRRVAGGVELSGGEWQRIALARAMLAVAAGAGVLVLDEPTANLDARAETELYDRFLELTTGVTTIVISHRFSTVRRAERIIVVRGGRVVESGTHDELLALGGRYARMFRLQAARFEVPSA